MTDVPSLDQKFYVDRSGSYLGSWTDFEHPQELALDRDGAVILIDGAPWVFKDRVVISSIPADAIEVPFPPADGRDIWDGSKYIPHIEPAPAPDAAALISVLLAKGLVSESELAAAMSEAKGKKA